jgi:hypothetical protein
LRQEGHFYQKWDFSRFTFLVAEIVRTSKHEANKPKEERPNWCDLSTELNDLRELRNKHAHRDYSEDIAKKDHVLMAYIASAQDFLGQINGFEGRRDEMQIIKKRLLELRNCLNKDEDDVSFYIGFELMTV